MSYFGEVQIINKKTLGKKLLYLVVSDSMKKWIDYEQLTEYLPQVIEFEKKQTQLYMNKRNQKSSKEKFIQDKIQEAHQIRQSEPQVRSEIKYIEFVDIVGYDNQTREKIILFKAFLANGRTEFMTNAEIKMVDMSALVRFYESQIKSTR